MSNNKQRGVKASVTNKLLYGDDYYKRIGAMGGRKSRKGGFWYTKHIRGQLEPIREAGRKGGTISRRGKAK